MLNDFAFVSMSIFFKSALWGLSCLVSFTPFLSHPMGKFTDNQYSQYTYESFNKLPVANEEIDLENIDYDLLNAAIFYATNKQRKVFNKPQFQFYPLLRDAAVTQSAQMVKYNFFDHVNPKNAKLKNLKDRLEYVGGSGKYLAAGENISEYFLMDYQPKEYFRVEKVNNKNVYYNIKTNKQIKPHSYRTFGEAIVADWMTSPGHRANILDDRYTHLGCGSLYSTKANEFPKAKATQVFGKLKDLK
jgi:uncharacterized protein YkwD